MSGDRDQETATVFPVQRETSAGLRLRAGSDLGPYRVLGVLGEGGMGVVYRAQHRETLEEVALKTVRAPSQSLLQGIRREIHALRRIRHPGLVRIVDTGVHGGMPWYAMEMLHGQILDRHLKALATPAGSTLDTAEHRTFEASTLAAELIDDSEHGYTGTLSGTSAETRGSTRTLAPEVPLASRLPGFLGLISRLCSALACLHGEGLVHRDLKPSNIIIREDGTPVVFDFGLVSLSGAIGQEVLEVGGRIMGTPAYMSPEQVQGEYVDARTDLYAVGCLLYVGVTGRVPFVGTSERRVMWAQVHQMPAPPSRLVDGVPPALESLILRLLAKRPQDRLGHAADVVAALAELGIEPGDWLERWPPRVYLYRPGFVGRETTLGLLNQQIRQALEGDQRCIFIRGTSGIGKTRILMEAASQLDRAGVRVFTGECLAVDGAARGSTEVSATPLYPFRPLLQAIADRCLEAGSAERLLGTRARILATVEPALAELVPPDSAQPGEAATADLRAELLDALAATLVAFAREAQCVVFIDDLQWADELTLTFLGRYHAGDWNGRGLAFVAAYRSEEEHTRLLRYRHVFGQGDQGPRAPQIDVAPLDEATTRAILCDMLGCEHFDARLVHQLTVHSEGNPFFIAEYLRTAIAEGLLRRDPGGRWQLASESVQAGKLAIPLPGSLRQLVARRLEGLSASARRLLELCAVLGREIDGELLRATVRPAHDAGSDDSASSDDSEVLEALAVLVTRHILEEPQAHRFRFVHDKLREIAYEQTPPERRQALHQQAAEAIEQRHAGTEELPLLYPLLAHHWRQVVTQGPATPAQVGKAIEYLEQAAHQALWNGLLRQAVDFGLEASRLLSVDITTDPAQIGRALADELAHIEQLMAGRRPMDLLALPACTEPRVERTIAILLSIHPAAHSSLQPELAALLAAKNMSLTLAHGHSALSPSVYSIFAIVRRLLSGDARGAYELSRLAMELAARHGQERVAAVTFVHTWFLSHWIEPLHASIPVSQEGARAGLAAQDLLFGCYHLGAEVVYLGASGAPLDQVIAAAERNRALIRGRVSQPAYHCLLERQSALALAGRTLHPLSLSDGKFDESRDLESICRTDNYNQTGYYWLTRLRLAYYHHQYDTALEHAERASALLTAFQGQVAEIDFRLFHALALLGRHASGSGAMREQALARAQAHLDELRAWTRLCPANFAHRQHLVEAELARAHGHSVEALALHEQAASEALAHGYPHHAALARELAGMLAMQLGHGQAASISLREASRLYQHWGAAAKVADLATRFGPLLQGA